jgi:hypothetical protein
MHIQRSPWSPPRLERCRATWSMRKDLLAVLVVCAIFGLQILAVMLCTGGPDAYSLVASEGMQFE